MDIHSVIPARWRCEWRKLGVDWISISAGGKFEDAIHKPGDPLYPYTGYSGDRCMPGEAYPDMANVYLSEGIKSYLNSQAMFPPVVATGKIRTPDQAEECSAGTQSRFDRNGARAAGRSGPAE